MSQLQFITPIVNNLWQMQREREQRYLPNKSNQHLNYANGREFTRKMRLHVSGAHQETSCASNLERY